MIFSPHPEDETLGCGGTILKAIQENKRVKVIFLTNGDAYTEAASAWFKKKPEELTPGDYIALGEERQKEVLSAIEKLGLKREDAIFLSYPDTRLLSLWKQDEDETNPAFIKSKTTKTEHSPYEKTYACAIRGYTKNNLLSDIENILKEYQPKRIYIPHPLDINKDQIATTLFVNLALEELIKNGKNKWVDSLGVSYYLVHSSVDEFTPSSWPAREGSILGVPSYFSQDLVRSENILDFKKQKIAALGTYRIPLNLGNDFIEKHVKDNELFWDVPGNKKIYLRQLEEEWGKIAKVLKGKGYNVNFAPVVDVAGDIESPDIHLVRKQRIYSQEPRIITELASAVISGMDKEGIIAVIKHFPGLGGVYADTHRSLPKITVSKSELYKRDIFPFRKLIKKYPNIWIMIDHAIYTCLSDKPASLSYEIQTKLLRERLGFKGMIVVDELDAMGAIKEYALKQQIKEPYIGEIVLMAFQAGADMAIIYPYFNGKNNAEEREKIISSIIDKVRQAIKEGRFKEETLDLSVKRILREKEKILKMPLGYLLKAMSLKEKVCQKLIFDCYDEIGVFKKYNLGGMYLHETNYKFVEEAQKDLKIPMFIIGQHEGGSVSQHGISTRSAYTIGKEFKRTIDKTGERTPRAPAVRNSVFLNKPELNSTNFEQLDKLTRNRIIHIIIDSINELIAFLARDYVLPAQSNYLSPLTYVDEGAFEIKFFNDVPITWIKKFPDSEIAFYAYQLFRKAFEDWPDSQKISITKNQIISQLLAFKKRIQKIKSKEETGRIRVLCLGAHPDDEDAEALAYFGKKFNCETYVLLATRGEGGENQIGSVLNEELGFLRSEEMEKSASILGVKKVYYLGKKDFGYCTSTEEVSRKWGKEDTLKKLVYFFRLVRPHIIITKHSKSDMHCQHRALIALAGEAFELAGDPNAYTEMIKEGLLPWQPLKYYQRDKEADSSVGKVFINSQENVAAENKTIHQIARETLSQHLTQGAWQWPDQYDPEKIYFRLIKSRVSLEKQDAFFEGVSPDLDSPGGKEAIQASGLPGVKIIKDLKIGLINKNNNALFIALKALSYDFKILDEEFLRQGDLSSFDTIILGEGVYAFFLPVIQANSRLLEFVKNGGNLIVFPQHLVNHPLFPYAPYPFQIYFEPISDENAPVTILTPEHPLFNFPNKISPLDFTGWIQERGLSFPFEYSKDYTELIGCSSDAGKSVKGGYLVVHYGKGSYIYTGYSWSRQFRIFHPGAYKNLANMLAYSLERK